MCFFSVLNLSFAYAKKRLSYLAGNIVWDTLGSLFCLFVCFLLLVFGCLLGSTSLQISSSWQSHRDRGFVQLCCNIRNYAIR